MFENNQKRRVSLNIAGTELTIITTSSEIELKKLEENLSSSVEKILDAKPNASMLDAVLLVALSNEQKLYTEDKTAENLRTQIREYANEANKAVLELAEAKREIESLKLQVQNLKNNRY